MFSSTIKHHGLNTVRLTGTTREGVSKGNNCTMSDKTRGLEENIYMEDRFKDSPTSQI